MPVLIAGMTLAIRIDTELTVLGNRSGGYSRTSRSSPETTRDVLLILLAFAAGCVDAASYLGLGEVLTSAMTGNTVLLGLAIGQAKMQAAYRSSVALAGFVFGAVLAASIAERKTKGAVWPRGITVILAVEFAVLAAFAFGWHFAGDDAVETGWSGYLLIGAAGIAMGMQSVAVHRLRVAGVATTYVTGTLTNSAIRLVEWLHSPPDAASARVSRPDVEPSGQAAKSHGSAYLLIVWLFYGLGAVAAGFVKLCCSLVHLPLLIGGATVALHWPTVTLLLPIAIIAIVIAAAAIRFGVGTIWAKS